MTTDIVTKKSKPNRRRMGCGMLCIVRTVRLWIDYFLDFLFSLYYKNKRQIVPAVKDKYVTMSATQLAQKIRDKTIKSEDLVQYHINRIKEVNDVINAVVDERFEEALEEARKIDEDIAKGVVTAETFKEKPFLGVPFTSKESTNCEGMSISYGLISRKGMKGVEDAEIIKNMKKTGAILIAVTNVPQVNLWIETHNPIYGVTKNPYDSTRNVGGSSGGEAAIIAACGSPIGVGTDIGGSIRIPANMCGIFGHKLSNELTPTKGLTYRDGSEGPTTMVVCGPMTRFAEDLIPGIKAMVGPEACKRLQLDLNVDVKKLKYYYILDGGEILMSTPRPDITESMKKVISHFNEVAQTEEVSFPQTKYSVKLYKYWLHAETKNFRKDVMGRIGKASLLTEFFKYWIGKSQLEFPAIMFMINSILPTPKASWAEKNTKELKSAIIDKLGDDGVLLYMSSPMVAQYHHGTYFRPFNMCNFALFNFLKLPSTQVPLGLNAEGLPLGIQVVAAPYNDHLTIAVAKELEKAFGGYVAPYSMQDTSV